MEQLKLKSEVCIVRNRSVVGLFSMNKSDAKMLPSLGRVEVNGRQGWRGIQSSVVPG